LRRLPPNELSFATPEQNILFDINEFDETLRGVDFTADLKRLAASVAVAALAADLSKKRARAIAATTVEAYRTHRAAWNSFPRWNLEQQGQRRCSKVSLEVAAWKIAFSSIASLTTAASRSRAGWSVIIFNCKLDLKLQTYDEWPA
jgi:hypothetical protein